MAIYRGDKEAFGKPGLAPKWTHGGKDGVGTAYSTASRVWFTLWNGILTEVFYPTIDRPQLRDFQYLISDGKTFFHEEKRHLTSRTERAWPHTLGYRIVNSDPAGRYAITKEVIADPHLSCVLQRTILNGNPDFLSTLHIYALCAPHLDGGGLENNASVIEASGRWLLAAEKNGSWLVMGATVPFSRLSCGYVGCSDGWTDIADNFEMDWQFDRATAGNVALTGELDLGGQLDFTMGLAFGNTLHSAITTLFQALGMPFSEQLQRYREQWRRSSQQIQPLESVSRDGGHLYHSSLNILLAHEDKTYPGAFIASLSIPWGEAKGAEDTGGYHLVWTRDMCQSAGGLLAAGKHETPLRALMYLAASQHEDGGFSQNFWINGEPYWRRIQLDEVAFPVLLAWKLKEEGALLNFDPYAMVMRGAAYLLRHGPVTEQERWEETAGYSPATLASNIAALICAAGFARERNDDATAQFLEEYADFLESHIESWTVTTEGTLLQAVPRHYIQILPALVDDCAADANPNAGIISISNRPPDQPFQFPARDVVDPGFLELVRYGIRKPDDPVIVDSLRVVDAVLKVDTPQGPCWRRYNHDGYGQRADGGSFDGWGVGRAWPLLTGERAHYELAAGHDVRSLIATIERFASKGGLLPEQIWDSADLPAEHMYLGKPTGSAMPLVWAHSEYIKLLRSVRDGQVFDRVEPVHARYVLDTADRARLEIWKLNCQIRKVRRGLTLRILADAPFLLRWSLDNWKTQRDSDASPTVLGIGYVDIPIDLNQHSPVRFTFFWPADERWQNCDYEVAAE